MKTWFVYIVTVEPGPRSPGEDIEHYIDVSQYRLPVQEHNSIGDTVFRKPLGIVVARDEDQAFHKAERLVGQ